MFLQPEPHQSFSAEVATLQSHFGHLKGGRGAYILGDALNGMQWHVFVAENSACVPVAPTYTLEICMTELCTNKVEPFTPHCSTNARSRSFLAAIGCLPGCMHAGHVALVGRQVAGMRACHGCS